MPHTPEPEGLDPVPPPHLVFYVEQALLGALLLDPHRADEASGIGPDSFSTAAHAALYRAIASLPPPDAAEHAKNTRWLDRVLAAAREQARGLSPSYLHALIQVCPWPSHAPAYARMVEAEHARRRLQAAAERLVHTVHDASLAHPVKAALTEADALTKVVDDIAHRFPPRAGVMPHTIKTAPPATPYPVGAVEEERMLLATATAYPSEIASVRWLLPDDLVLPLHAGLWQCLVALDRRNEPVDPVTVLWEAQQRGFMDGGNEPGEVLRMLAEPAGSVEHWGERALQRSLLATAEHTARRIEAYVGDRANSPFQLVVGARRALADVSSVRVRWRHSTKAVPPLQRRPEVTTRARPPTTRAARTVRSTRATR
ncbi:replicative DNA helicase [Streptomyces sp. GF20]|uniref:DnaB-like helicase N-terminal domain-containing protein n=1 Tax=Streptomyces sp. GF20 TaxID=2692235 RepID=UPI001316D5AF|nr:DnaB-like helicase N-terminal domain-containing protein [Streptomyces sp. GF20]QHC18923.1 replicative DNA helicase [Streptomyces sp. GF20]